MKLIYCISVCCLLVNHCIEAKNRDQALKYERLQHLDANVKQSNVFYSGKDGVNSYRIPSMVCTNKGSLLFFCEARKESWRDKSPTDLVMKRSVDQGITWEKMQVLIPGGRDAYMDPTPIVDRITGRILVFTSFWPEKDHSGMANKASMIYSDDDGETWSDVVDMTKELTIGGKNPCGFGPGIGFQMQGDRFKNRLVLPVRYITSAGVRSNHVVVSDDAGKTWKVGAEIGLGEYQVAEGQLNKLVCNMRYNTTKENNGLRATSTSVDGGFSWSEITYDTELPRAVCQACTYACHGILYYSGIEGGEKTKEYDERERLIFTRSMDGGKNWVDKKLLNKTSAGYSCIAHLKDGRIAIIFETAETPGFTRIGGKRPEGWMRLDLLILD